jgi:hypothetical protein
MAEETLLGECPICCSRISVSILASNESSLQTDKAKLGKAPNCCKIQCPLLQQQPGLLLPWGSPHPSGKTHCHRMPCFVDSSSDIQTTATKPESWHHLENRGLSRSYNCWIDIITCFIMKWFKHP